MKKFICIIAFILPHAALSDVLMGTARNRSGDIVYFERHEVQKGSDGLNSLVSVEYSKPDGSVFATMKSDFSKNKNVPDTVFHDRRFETVVTLRVVGEKFEFSETKNGEVLPKKVVSKKNGLTVASQGFDNFVRSNAKALADGPVEFQFGVLSEKDFFSLTALKSPSTSSNEIEYSIRSSHWYIRMLPFVSDLKVVYDAKEMRLKTFVGRSNILDEQGKTRDVTIDYRWITEETEQKLGGL